MYRVYCAMDNVRASDYLNSVDHVSSIWNWCPDALYGTLLVDGTTYPIH